MPAAGSAVHGLIATLEALLIEGLEPPQNRRQGDGFNAVEFIQVPDETVVTHGESGMRPALTSVKKRELRSGA